MGKRIRLIAKGEEIFITYFQDENGTFKYSISNLKIKSTIKSDGKATLLDEDDIKNLINKDKKTNIFVNILFDTKVALDNYIADSTKTKIKYDLYHSIDTDKYYRWNGTGIVEKTIDEIEYDIQNQIQVNKNKNILQDIETGKKQDKLIAGTNIIINGNVITTTATGITTAQANAIGVNTAKVGITTIQAQEIIDNKVLANWNKDHIGRNSTDMVAIETALTNKINTNKNIADANTVKNNAQDIKITNAETKITTLENAKIDIKVESSTGTTVDHVDSDIVLTKLSETITNIINKNIEQSTKIQELKTLLGSLTKAESNRLIAIAKEFQEVQNIDQFIENLLGVKDRSLANKVKADKNILDIAAMLLSLNAAKNQITQNKNDIKNKADTVKLFWTQGTDFTSDVTLHNLVTNHVNKEWIRIDFTNNDAVFGHILRIVPASGVNSSYIEFKGTWLKANKSIVLGIFKVKYNGVNAVISVEADKGYVNDELAKKVNKNLANADVGTSNAGKTLLVATNGKIKYETKANAKTNAEINALIDPKVKIVGDKLIAIEGNRISINQSLDSSTHELWSQLDQNKGLPSHQLLSRQFYNTVIAPAVAKTGTNQTDITRLQTLLGSLTKAESDRLIAIAVEFAEVPNIDQFIENLAGVKTRSLANETKINNMATDLVMWHNNDFTGWADFITWMGARLNKGVIHLNNGRYRLTGIVLKTTNQRAYVSGVYYDNVGYENSNDKKTGFFDIYINQGNKIIIIESPKSAEVELKKAIALNTDKTGITQAQADAIVVNTNKVSGGGGGTTATEKTEIAKITGKIDKTRFFFEKADGTNEAYDGTKAALEPNSLTIGKVQKGISDNALEILKLKNATPGTGGGGDKSWVNVYSDSTLPGRVNISVKWDDLKKGNLLVYGIGNHDNYFETNMVIMDKPIQHFYSYFSINNASPYCMWDSGHVTLIVNQIDWSIKGKIIPSNSRGIFFKIYKWK